MYYLMTSYQDHIIICNPKNDIIARVMHYDFKNEQEALNQAESIVEALNMNK
jgi:hypothetical protein